MVLDADCVVPMSASDEDVAAFNGVLFCSVVVEAAADVIAVSTEHVSNTTLSSK